MIRTLSDKNICLSVDAHSGSIVALRDVRHAIDYVHEDKVSDPFRLETETGMVSKYHSFSCEKKENRLELIWKLNGTLTLHGMIRLTEDGICFRAETINEGETVVKSVEWPIVSGIGSIGSNPKLIHPFATGMLVHDPLSLFSEENPGIRHAPYPESFSGASMQFFAYYAEHGGMMMIAKDSDGHQKWLNFFRNQDALEATHRFGYERLTPGNGCNMDYDVCIRMFSGDWHDAADIYKEWAVKQPFVPEKTAYRDHPKWLYQHIGLSTFGINSRYERTLWLNKYHDDLGLPIFHILGPDWPKEMQDFNGNKPGGLSDWLPTAFNQDNLRTIRDNNDYWAPFEFDFLVAPDKTDAEVIQENLQKIPEHPASIDKYTFTMLCPATTFTKAFHRDRDVMVYEEEQPDAFYYDISANNLLNICVSDTHNHEKGGGKVLSDAYNDIYEDTKDALKSAANKHVPLGTEMMNEYHLKQLDYYQARAWAQPASTLEFWPYHDWIKTGQIDVVPLFTYVYHEYGALRLDGWGKLVEQLSDLFFLTVAKTYLWGGVYEINHEYSPMESINKKENTSDEHYKAFEKRDYPYMIQRMRYIKQFAHLRCGIGNDYLAYGEMEQPPIVRSPKIQMDWYHYNHLKGTDTYNDQGTIETDAILISAYRSVTDGSHAVFLANVDNKAHEVPVTFEIDRYKIDGQASIVLYQDFHSHNSTTNHLLDSITPGDRKTVTVSLAPKDVVMLKISKKI